LAAHRRDLQDTSTIPRLFAAVWVLLTDVLDVRITRALEFLPSLLVKRMSPRRSPSAQAAHRLQAFRRWIAVAIRSRTRVTAAVPLREYRRSGMERLPSWEWDGPGYCAFLGGGVDRLTRRSKPDITTPGSVATQLNSSPLGPMN
jgi:hypothetical protein